MDWPDFDTMTDDEFARWYQNLDPATQQMFNYEQGYAGMNTPTPAFAGGYSPEISRAGFDVSSMFAPNPDVDAKGNTEPWDLSNEAQAWNYIQDQMQTLLSPSSMIMGGPGTYDPSLFQPTMKYSGPTVDDSTPGADYVNQLANMQGGGAASYLARSVAGGTDYSTALGALRKMVADAADNPDVEQDPEVKAILDSIPRVNVDPTKALDMTDEEKTAATYDVDSLVPYAQELAQKIASDPTSVTGFQDESTGTWYQNAPTEEWSKAAQAFRDAGLPMPTESYTDASRLDAMAPVDTEGFATAKTADDLRRKTLTDQKKRTETNYDQLQGEYDKYLQERKFTPVNPPSPAPPGTPAAFDNKATFADVPRWNNNPYVPSVVPDYSGLNDTPISSGPKERTWSGPLQATPPPNAYMKNGQWTFGQMDPDTVARYSQSATNWSPMMGSPVDTKMLDQSKAERDRARANYSAGARMGTTGTGANQRFLVRPEGELERTAAAAVASQMQQQGRTPLTDAYMQRMMAMRGFGIR